MAGVAGTPYNLPFNPSTLTDDNAPVLVLGENGGAFATDSTDGGNGPMVTSFIVASGSVNCSYQAGAQDRLSIIEATAGNGLVAKVIDPRGSDTIIRFDGGGTLTADPVTGSQLDYYTNSTVIGVAPSGGVAATVAMQIEPPWAPGGRPKGDAQHNGATDPGLKVVGVRDCANKQTLFNVTSYTRYPIYELWDQNRNKPLGHYTVFEHVVDKSTGGIADATRCPDGSNTGTTPCGYADGTTIGFNTFLDSVFVGTSPESTRLQSFEYGLPSQRKWPAELYRTPTVGIGPPEQIPNRTLEWHLRPNAEPLIQERLAPYMGPWFNNSSATYSACTTEDPIN